MICEECETVMHWRCTNQITNIAKYKCPCCGNVQTEKIKPMKPTKEAPNRMEPRFYYKTTQGTYIVRKEIDNQKKYLGTYGDEATAREVVDESIKCDWSLDITSIRERLNIQKVGRSWFCV